MTDSDNSEKAVEFSRLVDLTTLSSNGKSFNIQANDQEKCDLAARFSVEQINNLTAECKIKPAKKGEYLLTGHLTGELVQLCGVSLIPVDETVSCDFKISLLQKERKRSSNNDEIDFEPEDEDTELLTSNMFDIGEMVAQYFSLEINPYLRSGKATGKELGQKILQEEEVEAVPEKKNPFEVLKSLKE